MPGTARLPPHPCSCVSSPDEEWFRLIHVAIEQQAAPAVAALPTAQAAGAAGDTGAVRQALEGAAAALRSMQATLDRMGEMCDPYGKS